MPVLARPGRATIAPEGGEQTKHTLDPSPQDPTKGAQGGQTPPPSSFVTVTRRFT